VFALLIVCHLCIVDHPYDCVFCSVDECELLNALLSPLDGGCVSRSNFIPNPTPASEKSHLTAIFIATSRSLVRVSTRVMTGKTLTWEERSGLVMTGGLRMTGSASHRATLLMCVDVRAWKERAGRWIAEGGIIARFNWDVS
jgi:hypothetical protein